MLLDTGADVTLLPDGIVRELAIIPVAEKRYELTGFNESTSLSAVVRAEMIFLNWRSIGLNGCTREQIGTRRG